jgi:hypothetical protein
VSKLVNLCVNKRVIGQLVSEWARQLCSQSVR